MPIRVRWIARSRSLIIKLQRCTQLGRQLFAVAAYHPHAERCLAGRQTSFLRQHPSEIGMSLREAHTIDQLGAITIASHLLEPLVDETDSLKRHLLDFISPNRLIEAAQP